MSINPQLESQPKTLWHKCTTWFSDKVVGGIIVALCAGLFFWAWNWSTPILQYSNGEVIKFSGAKEADAFGLFVITISNDGRRMAENVQYQIVLADSKIQELKAGPSLLNPAHVISDDKTTATITCAILNAGEFFEVAIKASNPNKIAPLKKITLRAKDVTGTLKTKRDFRSYDFLIVVLTITVILLIRTRMKLTRLLEQELVDLGQRINKTHQIFINDIEPISSQIQEIQNKLNAQAEQRRNLNEAIEKGILLVSELQRQKVEKHLTETKQEKSDFIGSD